jgi:Ca2+/Na+ antiporter
MSTTDRLLLFLHIGFAIFTLGPLTAATMATPRHIRKGDTQVVRYLNHTTRIYGFATLGILLFGLIMARDRFDQFWVSASMTLFIVALVLLFIVERDQRKSTHLLEAAAADEPKEPDTPEDPVRKPEVAQVERGRIAAISGVIALLWLVILILMVWNA